MQWGRAKTVIIALLVAVNLFLLTQVIKMVRANKNISADYAKTAAETLSGMGLVISAEDVPTEIKNLPRIVFTQSTADYDMLITHVFSALPRQLQNDILIEDGSTMGMYYKNGSGIIKITFDGRFRFESYITADKQTSLQAARQIALNFAKLSGLDESHFKVISEKADGDGFVFEIAQLQHDAVICDCGMTVKVAGGSVEYAFGKLMTSVAEEIPLATSTTSVNALFSVAAYYEEEKRVSAVTLCYYPVFEDDGALFTVTFTPAYRVDFDGGDCAFYLNATGQIVEG